MKNRIVLDAGVLGLFFNRDPRVTAYVEDGGEDGHIFVAGVNLSEFYYKTCRSLGREVAETRFRIITGNGVEVIGDTELDRLAALERCRRSLDLSLADCYALALSKRLNGLLLTTDGELGKTRDAEVKHFPV